MIIDISDPLHPAQIGVYPSRLGMVLAVATAGDYAYLADSMAGVEVVDIRDPAKPRWQAGIDGFRAWGLSVRATGYSRRRMRTAC